MKRRVRGNARWSMALAAVTAVVTCAPPPQVARVMPPSTSATFVYRCEGDYRFSARVEQDSIRLGLIEGLLTLPQVVAASGTRYEVPGIVFWSKGLNAVLQTPGESFQRCKGERADTPWAVSRLLGYDFRAVGQEPGWMVEIDEGRRLHVLADYGAVDFQTPAPEPVTQTGGTIVYRARTDTHELSVVIAAGPCQDTMSGEVFSRTVVLTMNGQTYEGCGRPLDGSATDG